MIDKRTPERHRSVRPFNSPLECGLRALFILSAASGTSMDLQRIVAYDYILVHSGDIDGGPSSLHPAVPHRGTELLVKRTAIQAGLNRMMEKELVKIEFAPEGFLYQATELTAAFIGLLRAHYAHELTVRAEWINGRFSALNAHDLDEFIARNVGRWGSEFESLTAVDSLEL